MRALIFFIILAFSNNVLASYNGKSEIFDIYLNKYLFPVVYLPIEGISVPLIVDTGAEDLGLSLDKEIIKKLKDARSDGVSKFSDLSGASYTTNKYTIKYLMIGSVLYQDLSIAEHVKWGVFHESGPETIDDHKIMGVIGLKFLKQHPVIMDYEKMKFVILENNNTIHSDEYDHRFWRKFFFKNDSGMQLSAGISDNIHLTFILDSGASNNIIKSNFATGQVIRDDCNPDNLKQELCRYIYSNKLSIENSNFGDATFYLYDFNGIQADGILGFPFFQNKIMLFDLARNFFLVK